MKCKCRTNDSRNKLIHKDLIRAIERERKNLQIKYGKKVSISSVYASKMLAKRYLK